MNGLAKICWLGAGLYALAGMAMGIMMAASGDHSLMPAHAHLNLLGWVSLALYGAFYSLYPQAAQGWFARAQVAAAHVGTLVIVPGIALVLRGGSEAPAKAGALVIFGSMLLFVAVVARTGRRKAKVPAGRDMAQP